VTILDVDLCGPSMPTIFGCEEAELNNTQVGWEPVCVSPNINLVSSGFMLPDKDSAII